ncbi:MAG TPA: hypothetical protein VKT99_09425 [Xanthobacteraceae bacterium]|nr:hypothetical protein [Xanthobacteraceae bacterium]
MSAPTERYCCDHAEGLGLPGILPRRLRRHCGASVVTAPDAAINEEGPTMSANKLTDAQLVLLSAAAQRPERAIELAPGLNGSAAKKTAGKLLRDGLIEEIPACGALPV